VQFLDHNHDLRGVVEYGWFPASSLEKVERRSMRVVIDGKEYVEKPETREAEFHLGDFVELVAEFDDSTRVGQSGKIVAMDSENFGVEFSTLGDVGHTLFGATTYGHGYWFPARCLRKIR
jgi:hypothetical protein